MSDGALRFSTKIDNSGVGKDLKDLEWQIKKSQESISKMENAKLPIVKQAETLGAKLDAAKKKAARLKAEMESIKSATAPGSDPAAYLEAITKKAEVEAALQDSEKEVASLQSQWDGVNDKIDEYDRKIQQATADIERSTEKAAELNAQLASPNQLSNSCFWIKRGGTVTVDLTVSIRSDVTTTWTELSVATGIPAAVRDTKAMAFYQGYSQLLQVIAGTDGTLKVYTMSDSPAGKTVRASLTYITNE